MKLKLSKLYAESFYLSAVAINVILASYVGAYLLSCRVIPNALLADKTQISWAKSYAAFFGGVEYTTGGLIGALFMLVFFSSFVCKSNKCCK